MVTILKTLPGIAAAALLLAGNAALAQVQSAKPSGSAPRAPGVTRAIEHPDGSKPDPTVDQTQPDSHQPETARDDQKHQPETASDKPTAPSSSEKAAAIAREGVRSNTPPSKPPQS
jgi:hypothetical protein